MEMREKYIRQTIYKSFNHISCHDIAKIKMVKKVYKDYKKICEKRAVKLELFAQEINEGRGKEFYIQLGKYDWQFKENGDCVHSGALMINKEVINALRRLTKKFNKKNLN